MVGAEGAESATQTSSQRVSTDCLGGQRVELFAGLKRTQQVSAADAHVRSREDSGQIKELFVTLAEQNELRHISPRRTEERFSLFARRPTSQPSQLASTVGKHCDGSLTTHEGNTWGWFQSGPWQPPPPSTAPQPPLDCYSLLNAGNMGTMLLVSRESASCPLTARSAARREE